MHCEGLGGRLEALEQPKTCARASWRGREASKRCPSEAPGRFCEAPGALRRGTGTRWQGTGALRRGTEALGRGTEALRRGTGALLKHFALPQVQEVPSLAEI